MQSVHDRLRDLEADVLAEPLRISVYHDLPFAIFHYTPSLEFEMRQEINRFKTRLENAGKKVIVLSLADLLWDAIKDNDTLENIIENEKRFCFNRQADAIHTYLTLDDFIPLPQRILSHLKDASPLNTILLLKRAGAMAPNLYRMSILLNELHRQTMVPTILFYPGEKHGEAQLQYMNMEGRDAISRSNYRVKIY